jgi:hypothetical protein
MWTFFLEALLTWFTYLVGEFYFEHLGKSDPLSAKTCSPPTIRLIRLLQVMQEF